MGLKIQVLASGSKGNCIWICSERTQILIDAGLSGAEITRRLNKAGGNPRKLEGILVSHEHRDHVNSLGILSRRYDLPVLINQDTLSSLPPKIAPFSQTFIFKTGNTFKFGDLHIHPFSIPHDASDPVGFIIKENNNSVGICTDLGMATKLIVNYLKSCNVLVLESNHDPDLLINGPYPWELKKRISSKHGHLSNIDAVRLTELVYHSDLKYLVLAHLSETNNHPKIVEALFAEARQRNEWSNLKVEVSTQNIVGKPIIL